MPLSKQHIRNRFRQLRRELAPELVDTWSQSAAEHLLNSGVVRPGQHIALYLAQDHEADPRHLEQALRAMDCQLYLPVIDQHHMGHMRFAPWKVDDVLRPNRFGIPEPEALWEHCALASALDLVVVPLVAFSNDGIRLGMGGGFYDRALQGCTDKPLRIGFAFSRQYCPDLRADPWDQPLHGVVTEAGFRAFGKPVE